MAKYEIHKGVGRPLELLGLKSIYIFLVPVVIILAVIMFFILNMNGCQTELCLIVSLVSGITALTIVLKANRKYGKVGFIKIMVAKSIPRQIKFNKRIRL